MRGLRDRVREPLALAELMKIKVPLKDLAKYAAYISAPVFHVAGKLAVVVPMRWATMIVYCEGEPAGEFLKVDTRTASFEWANERAMDPMYTYLPVINVVEAEGLEL